MKHFVNVFQLAAIVIILYPIFYVWDTDKVDNFCEALTVGMQKAAFLQLTEEHSVKLLGPFDEGMKGGKWHATVVARIPYIDYRCQIKGLGPTVTAFKIKK